MRSTARLLTAALAVTASACTSERPPAARGATTRPTLTWAQAADRIAALPEFVAFRDRVDRLSNGTVKTAIVGDGDQRQDGEWSVGAYEDHDDHYAVWQRFQVDTETGAVRVERADGDYEPLAAWRARPD